MNKIQKPQTATRLKNFETTTRTMKKQTKIVIHYYKVKPFCCGYKSPIIFIHQQ